MTTPTVSSVPTPSAADTTDTDSKITGRDCVVCFACLGFFPGLYLVGAWLVGTL